MLHTRETTPRPDQTIEQSWDPTYTQATPPLRPIHRHPPGESPSRTTPRQRVSHLSNNGSSPATPPISSHGPWQKSKQSSRHCEFFFLYIFFLLPKPFLIFPDVLQSWLIQPSSEPISTPSTGRARPFLHTLRTKSSRPCRIRGRPARRR